MKTPEANPVIIYDGWCNLCFASVRFVIRHDRKNIFRFASLQSEEGRKLISGLDTLKQDPESIVYIEGEKIYVRSSAVLHILKRMGGGWQVFYLFNYIPAFIRDAIYNGIARIRYFVFGRRASCTLPPPGRAYRG